MSGGGRAIRGGGSLAARLGRRFRDRALLRQALTHRSSAHESGERDAHYERLEFLGDAVLGFLAAEMLFRRDATADEGTLTRRKQAVVSSVALAEASRRLGLGEEARLGRGEESSGGRAKPSILADLFEAVLGAVYLDGGVRAARAFVRRHLGAELEAACAEAAAGTDHKTRLQEMLQGSRRETPVYRTVATSGPAHRRSFEVEVLAGGAVLGRGRGGSRKLAERDAAQAALAALAGAKEDDGADR